jgi:Ni/Co efflux regulator RcnB
MNYVLLAAAALSLVAGPALADPPHGHGKGHKGGAHHGGPPGLAKKPYGLPPGQAKKIYGEGEYLPRSYYSERYYVSDPYYREQLPPAPYGYRWVRYGEDAYLVQTRDGLIADIVRSLFN